MIAETPSPEAQQLHQLFYVSLASQSYDNQAIQSILAASRRNNPQLGVTGCLLFSGTHYAQVLEGEQKTIVALAARIAADPRHSNLRLLVECVTPERDYGGWSMGYMHDLELEDDLAELLAVPSQQAERLAGVMARMRPDRVIA